TAVRRITSSEFAALAGRSFLVGTGILQFISRDATVAILVVAQDELVGLADKLLARELAVLVLIEIAEVGLGKGRPALADGREFGLIETAVMVAVGQIEHAAEISLPLVAGVDAVVIGIPDVRTVRRRRISRRARSLGVIGGEAG